MNLALSTIFIFVLILPGILFRFAYLKGPYSKQNFKPSTIDEIIWAIVPSIFLHMIGYFVIDYFTKYKVNFRLLFALLSSEFAKVDFAIVDKNIYPFIFYLSAITVFSFVVGLYMRKAVVSLMLDYKYNFFRINNDWYYILTSNMYDRANAAEKKGSDIEFIQVDALVRGDKDVNVIYSGILHDFYLSKDEGLDKICLVEVYRRRFFDDRELEMQELAGSNKPDERYYSMPGDLFVIPYSQILNLNISYYNFSGGENRTRTTFEEQN